MPLARVQKNCLRSDRSPKSGTKTGAGSPAPRTHGGASTEKYKAPAHKAYKATGSGKAGKLGVI